MAKSKPLPEKAAVIGSGFGGLGAAIRLQSAGIQTVLYEARDLPGGRAYVYHDDGYTFDAGPTVITAPHTLTDLFDLTGKKLEDYIELMEVQPMYRLIWSDGDRFDYVRDETPWLNKFQSAVNQMLKGIRNSLNMLRKYLQRDTQNLLTAHLEDFQTWSLYHPR